MMQSSQIESESGEPIASFVFQGTVLRLHASNEPGMQPSANTAIVRVDRVLYSQEVLSGYTGAEVTFYQPGQWRLSAGQVAVFFTDVLIYGQSLVVQEVEPRVDSAAALEGRLLPPERHLQRRIEHADLIVRGEVLGVQQLEISYQLMSEHDPLWARAEVGVGRVLKGEQIDSVAVLFPLSGDYLWHKAPRFHPGERGTWLLRLTQIKELRDQAYTALSPLDFQPEETTDRFMALLRNLGDGQSQQETSS